MPRFRVCVQDRSTVLYIVYAYDADSARLAVEKSDDADKEFSSTIKDAEWYVDRVDHVEERDED